MSALRIFIAVLLTLLVVTPAFAQTVPSAFTSAVRYDVEGRVVGTISSDPDGAGVLGRLAERRTYDVRGLLVRVETGALAGWQDEGVAPVNWAGFTLLSQVDTLYDVSGRKARDTVIAGGVVIGVTQYSYDAADRLLCSAVRMNPVVYGALPSDACVLGPTGAFGADRITRQVYDGAGRVAVVQKAVGTPRAQDYARYTYTANGRQASVRDANNNLTTYAYDGFDRKTRTSFPSKTSAGVASADDYEAYGYDANGNRTSLRKRDGSVLAYQYDALNRLTLKLVPERAGLDPGYTRDVYYGYDNRGLQLYARFDYSTGEGVALSYDALGRVASQWVVQAGLNKILSYAYDANGNRVSVTHPDGQSFVYRYDALDRFDGLFEGSDGLYGRTFDGFGRVRYNHRTPGHHSLYIYDGLSRLASQTDAYIGSIGNVTRSYSYNPARQIATRSLDNDAYVYSADANVNRSYSANGLNQYVSAGPASFSYDANGNLTGDGANSYTYDVENRLIGVSGARTASLIYDALGRLFETTASSGGAATARTRFLHDGDELVGEYNSAHQLLRRYVHGAGSDDPLFWYEGAGLSDRRSLHVDHQGSVTGIANTGGTLRSINRYDEYGIPAPTNQGRFQYTGQAWLPEIGMYYYKARIYSPTLGRFMQTDPIGYDDGLNWYAYVGNDPVNKTDPTGLKISCTDQKACGAVAADINKLTKGTYAFNSKGQLYRASKTGGEGKSGTYDRRLGQAIAAKPTISIRVSDTGPRGNSITGPSGGGETLGPRGNATGANYTVTVTGRGWVGFNQNADGSNPRMEKLTPEQTLAHELAGHAIPRMIGGGTGNAVQNENIIMRENGRTNLRYEDPTHVE